MTIATNFDDIEKRFFCIQLPTKKLNREILLSWFDIRGPNFFLFKSAGKLNFYVCSFLYHDCLHIYCLNYIFDELLSWNKNTSFDFFFQIFYWKCLYNRSSVTGEPVVRWKRKNSPLSFFSWQFNAKKRFVISHTVRLVKSQICRV
jgi:hypothetical protein